MGNLSPPVQNVHDILKELSVHIVKAEDGFPTAAEAYGFDRTLFEEVVARELATLSLSHDALSAIGHSILMGYIAGKTGLLDKQPVEQEEQS